MQLTDAIFYPTRTQLLVVHTRRRSVPGGMAQETT